MTYATLLVNLQPGRNNGPVQAAAAELARRFGARAIGHSACQPMVMMTGDGFVCGDVYAADQERMESDLKAAEVEFRKVFEGSGSPGDWFSAVTTDALADSLSSASRSADLIITASVPNDTPNLSRVANVGSLVLHAGRPVLIVPPALDGLRLDRAVIAWNDTRESRRATLDALPLLRVAGNTTVVTLADEDDMDGAQARSQAVVEWLASHDVRATGQVVESTGDRTSQFAALIEESLADVVVAGAYGRSRLREWISGGITRDVLFESKHCVFMSH